MTEPVHQTGTATELGQNTSTTSSETGKVSQLDFRTSPPRSSSPARHARSPCQCPPLPGAFMAWQRGQGSVDSDSESLAAVPPPECLPPEWLLERPLTGRSHGAPRRSAR